MSAPADGHQFVEVKRTEGNDVGDLWQNTHIALQNGATYTFTFAVNPGNSDAAAGYSMLRAASYDLRTKGPALGIKRFRGSQEIPGPPCKSQQPILALQVNIWSSA